jgi:hypothetical protein
MPGPAGSAHEIVAEFQSDNLREMLMLGDCPDLLLAEFAEPKTILESQHRLRPFVERTFPEQTLERAGDSLIDVDQCEASVVSESGYLRFDSAAGGQTLALNGCDEDWWRGRADSARGAGAKERATQGVGLFRRGRAARLDGPARPPA